MKPLMTLTALILPTAALAHPGHLAEAAGHVHWIGLAAGGAAIAVAVLAALWARDAKPRDGDGEDGPAEDADPQEA